MKRKQAAAVLCPGPSLKQTWVPGETIQKYDITLAVNRAVLHDMVDVWCFNDPRVFVDTNPAHRPSILMPKIAERTIDKKGHHDRLYKHKIQHVDRIEYPMRIVTGFTNYTYPTALAYCKTLGVDSIDVYGNDRTSEPDYDGQMPQGCNRNPARWLVENGIVEQTDRWLKTCGITITRVTPDGRYGIT